MRRLHSRLKLNGLLTFLQGLFEVSHAFVEKARLAASAPVARIAADVRPVDADGLVEFSRYLPVVAPPDEKPFELGDTIAQFKGLRLKLFRPRCVPSIVVCEGQPLVCPCKGGIQLGSALEEWNRREELTLRLWRVAQSELLEGLERGSGELAKRATQLLYRSQRFS